ncbi:MULTISPECIES: hypothetical protein [Pseudomonas syringae group]|uniref:Uncharacterized protein n=1 Tax=Pseudomonas amygdali pv. ulmi TaxID=251720 RepID=A0A0Q0FXD9_PSEA0|nr:MULTISPECIES: hypothetical protein [Pseudomonas syringae group]KPZ05031.1 Uncharacterized protein ALO41_00410 [Pseudomonas amygdali pv. ulmi]KWS36830.1 hypothetical protein AL065_09785 [Pseudomonas amygdali pv. ulmi]QVK32282.1 hypothetical protein KIJ28_25065 [Pseudomonas syringae]
MLSDEEKELSVVIYRLLKQATSQQVIKDFLRSKGIPVSAQNRDDLYDKRIEPALREKRFSVSDLRGLLQTVEEFGRQHSFLFQCAPDRAQKLLSKARLTAIAKDEGLANLLITPLDLELPDTSTIVDIRMVGQGPDNSADKVIIKTVETRSTKALINETEDHALGRLTKVYAVTHKRAVSVVELHSSGLLELRIASQDSSTKYKELVRFLLGKVSKFIPVDGFAPVSLGVAKDKLLKNRDALLDEIRYSYSTARNDFGAVIQISAASQDENLSADDGSMAAMESFLAEDGHVTGTNVYVKIPNTDPLREIHLLISGEVNEFAVPVACSAGEYSHVRGKILSLNQ